MFESSRGQQNGTVFFIAERSGHGNGFPLPGNTGGPWSNPSLPRTTYLLMSTKTQTTTTHYHIQKKRRKEFIEEWRNYRQTVIRK